MVKLGIRAKKKQKVSKASVESPINPDLLSEESRTSLKKYHDESEPYKHVILRDLCKDDRMRLIHDELKHNMKADFKETDLFKVFQTGDFAAIDQDLIDQMPNMMALRERIYSEEFRNFVEEITGCNNLTDRIDCSCNAYVNGCHLLCHDDVIGTRCVSYIIYLTDPDDPWQPEDGGGVELFPLDEKEIVPLEDTKSLHTQGIPTSTPSRVLLPYFNSMLLFTVQPGRSYHAVQEVYSKDKPRLSVSGWYHNAEPPIGADNSSLQQIMRKGDIDEKFTPFPLLSNSDDDEVEGDDDDDEVKLTKEDKNYLKNWINPMYLTDQTLDDINEQFCENSSLQLNDFLLSKISSSLSTAIQSTDETELVGRGLPLLDYNRGVTENWSMVGPPHKRRYLTFTANNSTINTPADKIGNQLQEVRTKLFRSPIFAKFLRRVTSLRTIAFRDEVRRFRAGLDYTVAHYGVLTKIPRLDATLCFVDEGLSENEDKIEDKNEDNKTKEKDDDDDEEEEKEENAGDLWESGDVGGFECYIEADQDPTSVEAAEVYQAPKNVEDPGDEDEEDDTKLLSVSPACNVLSLVLRDEGIMRFVKYVSANAPGSRWDISSEYEIVQDD